MPGFAQELGCDLCKIFRATLGPETGKGMLAPMPWSKLMVTGGVEPTQENLPLGSKAGGILRRYGFQTVPEGQVAAEDWTVH